jgi:uncharacterized protein (TIGR04255 family)
MCSNMTESMGQWPSAPLVYVLAEVRCSPTLDVERRAAAVQEAIRAEYPLLEPVAEIRVSPGSPIGASTSPIFAFTDASKRRGVLISSSSVCYHVTEYVTSTEFLDQLGNLLRAIEPIYAKDTVTRLGLRYVDAIVPLDAETVFDYVNPALAGIPLNGDSSRRVQCVVEQPRQNGGVAIRFLALGIPIFRSPDLPALGLRQPGWVDRMMERQVQTAILDTDNWIVAEGPYQAESVLGVFKGLKAGITSAFLKAISPHAMTVWQSARSTS